MRAAWLCPWRAVRSEEFREAARLKAQLEELNRNDPVMAAKTALQKAIAEERYEAGRRGAAGRAQSVCWGGYRGVWRPLASGAYQRSCEVAGACPARS